MDLPAALFCFVFFEKTRIGSFLARPERTTEKNDVFLTPKRPKVSKTKERLKKITFFLLISQEFFTNLFFDFDVLIFLQKTKNNTRDR